jgi:putative Holliday junction resolvase
MTAHAVLAFDFGLKRIGIASGDTLTRMPAPRPAAISGPAGPDWDAITREVRALAPRVLVVGAPYNVDGSEGAMSGAARHFAAELERRFALPVHLVDERYSSLEGNEALKARRANGERRRRVQRADIDSAAAAVILGRWFAGEEQQGMQCRT